MGNLVHFYDKQYEGHLPRRCFPRRSSRFPSQQHRSRRGSRILLRESVHAKHVLASPTAILSSAHCPVRETPVRDTLKADSEEPSQGSEEKGAGEEEERRDESEDKEAGTPQDESASSSTSNSESDCHLRHRNPVP